MATKSGAKKHTHKYQRGHNFIWACGWPDCTHFMPTNVEFMMEGRASICWICDERMILSRANLKQTRPICNDCAKKAKGIPSDNEEKLINQLIQQKIEQNARLDNLSTEESAFIVNTVDSDCMTPEACKTGIVEIMCDNCREKLLY